MNYESNVEEHLEARPAEQRLPSPEQAAEAAAAAGADVVRYFPWVGPLLEAAILCPEADRTAVRVRTDWEGEDDEKHRAYSALMLSTMERVYPWLPPLLGSSKVILHVTPGLCSFVVPSRLGVVFDIPEFVRFTYLTPFAAEEGDALH